MAIDTSARHILHMATWHPVIDGVSGLFILEQCAALKCAGQNISLVCSRIQGLRDFRRARALSGMPGFFCTDDPVPTFGFKTWHFPGMRLGLAQFQKYMLQRRFADDVHVKGRPAIIHAHCVLEAGPAAREIARRERIPYVVTEHSSEILNGVRAPDRRAMAKAVYTDAAAVIAVSDALARSISDIAPTVQPIVIGNLVRDSVFQMSKRRSPRPDKITIIAISSLVAAKRIDHAIAALAALPPVLQRAIEFLIVGDGPERPRLEALAANQPVPCNFLGNLPHYDAMERLASAHLLVHPSSFETFGVVLAEAAALGVPVIATRSGGPESIVTDDFGILVEVDDVRQLRAGITEILENLPRWDRRRAKIIQECRSRFHEDVVVSGILGVYDKC
jgi:glycosyltransferase involved in cell wall biosynthesis